MPIPHDIVERLCAQLQTSTPDIPGVIASIASQCGNGVKACIIGLQPEQA
jgi:hypothetical protein